MKKKKNKSTTVYLNDELLDAVALKAIQDKTDKSGVVREALYFYLKETLDLLRNVMDDDTQKEKRAAWDMALGLMKIDVEPTKEFLDEVEKEIQGEISTDDMLLSWDKRHRRKSND